MGVNLAKVKAEEDAAKQAEAEKKAAAKKKAAEKAAEGE